MKILFAYILLTLSSLAQAQQGPLADMTGTYASRGCNPGTGYRYNLVYVVMSADRSALRVTFGNSGQKSDSVFGPSFFTMSAKTFPLTVNNVPAQHIAAVSPDGTTLTETQRTGSYSETKRISLKENVLRLTGTAFNTTWSCSFIKVSNGVDGVEESPLNRPRY